MVDTNTDTKRHGEAPEQASAEKVRKVIEDVCKSAGASIAIEERMGGQDQPAPGRCLHVTYTGERPMTHAQWFQLVNSIDEALDPTDLIDWESSELSGEDEPERMALWAIAATPAA